MPEKKKKKKKSANFSSHEKVKFTSSSFFLYILELLNISTLMSLRNCLNS